MVQEMSLVGTACRVTASNQGAAVKKPPWEGTLLFGIRRGQTRIA